MHWWVADYLDQHEYVLLGSWIFWVIFSICLHELGHGVAALSQGDDTPRKSGHMTMNPLIHMGKNSLLLFALVGIAWGMMPINPRNFRNGHLGEVIVAAAGPFVNLILAFVSLTGLGIFWVILNHQGIDPNSTTGFTEGFQTFLWIGGMLNIVLLIFNLIPLPPLDGSRIVAGIVPAFKKIYAHPQLGSISLIGTLAIFWFGADYIFGLGHDVSGWWANLIAHLL